MTFKQTIFIPFHLVDAAGVLFFSHVFTLAHQVWEHFIIQSLNLSWNHWFQHPEWIVPLKHVEAEYKKPLFSGQSCEIQLQILEIRASSFHICYHFYQNDRWCCIVKMVHVFCDRLTGIKQTIPSPIRALLEPLIVYPPHLADEKT
jgi:acyl-CoA thioester hydrolase/1,4-dihydroxy-2-naphthoyl-CoA hydrolase